MIITRNGIEIELTSEEIQQAYDTYLYECKVMDAKSHYEDWLEYEGFEKDLQSDVIEFTHMYGFEPYAASDPGNEHYLLEKFVSKFDEKFDCDRAENDIWYNAIGDVMQEIMKKYLAEQECKTFEVTYTETLAYKLRIKAPNATAAEEIWREKHLTSELDQYGVTSVVIETKLNNVDQV